VLGLPGVGTALVDGTVQTVRRVRPIVACDFSGKFMREDNFQYYSA
jgi:hypothetical protein